MQTITNFSVRITRYFGNHVDNIHTETIYTFFTPPGHHVKYFVTNCRVLPVQIRLFFREAVQIIHSCLFIELPCGTTKASAPVVWLFAVFRIFPDIVITIRVVFGFFTFQEPSVLIGAVVYYQVHHQFDAAFVHLGKHPIKIFHRTKFCHDILIIGDIISIVIIRGFVDR